MAITELGIQHSNKLTGTQSVSAEHGGNVLKPYFTLGGDAKSPWEIQFQAGAGYGSDGAQPSTLTVH